MKRRGHFLPTRRRAMQRAGLAAAGAVLGIQGLLREALAANRQPGVRSVKGNVSIDGEPAVVGQEIRPGQKLTTGPGSEAVFVIGTDAFLQRENSEFGLDSSAGVVVLRYFTGKVLSVFGKGRKQLETPTAVVGIRGTACYIEAEESRTYFCLCYGGAELRLKANTSFRRWLRTKHHESPVYIGAGATAATIRRADVENHTDAELVMLEALVGRVPPFHGKDYERY